MHLKSILLLLVCILILPPLETTAQISDSIAVSDSAIQAMIRREVEMQKQLLERRKNKQILDLKERQRSAKSRRMIMMIIVVACCLFFVASFVFLILWLVRKN